MSESWSKIRKILEQDRLCLKLRGRVRYYYTLYRKSHDQAALFEVKVDEKAYFRATPFNEAHYDEVFDKLRVDWGVEQWASWDEYETEYEYLDKEAELRTAQDGIVDSYLIPYYIQRYLNQSITESLNDENAVVRMFAILDRRVGKRTLLKLASNVDSQPKWLQKFYRLRFDVEGIEKKRLKESELYKELGILTDDNDKWEESIPYVASLLDHESVKIQAKALWLLGEMGLAYPRQVQDAVPAIASFLDSPEPLLRERAVNALGRIGRGDYSVIEPYWTDMFRFVSDEEPKVRLGFIWASENIATNTPDIYEKHMSVFEKLLYDSDDKVRMEAPEIFRVLGKRRPEFVKPYLERLQEIADTDENRVVRIHCLGAIKATSVK